MSSNTKEYNRNYKRKQRSNISSPAFRVKKPKKTLAELRFIKEQRRIKANENNRRIRMLCLQHYSSNIPFCNCCGEKEVKFLSIDHIKGGGNKHRRTLGSKDGKGLNMSYWLFRNNFPDGFQILCHNCNMAKGFYGECPHRQNRG